MKGRRQQKDGTEGGSRNDKRIVHRALLFYVDMDIFLYSGGEGKRADVENVRIFDGGSNIQFMDFFNGRIYMMDKKERITITKGNVKETISIGSDKAETLFRRLAAQMKRAVLEEQEAAGIFKYHGFLYIRCEICGKITGYYAGKNTDSYYCKECGSRTLFTEPLIPMQVNCKCGSRFRYRTNLTEKTAEMPCLECGAPVPMRYNGKKKEYQTME